jgi:hypothetical protein
MIRTGIALRARLFIRRPRGAPAISRDRRWRRFVQEADMARIERWITVLLFLLFAQAARAEFHTFQIEQIFSSADGTIQYVVLHEALGMNGEGFLGGHTLTSMSGGTTNTFVFPADLPGGGCGYGGCNPSPTANARVLIATQGFAALGLVRPDYVIPNGFLALANGTVNYAGVDQVSYAALPTDGTSAINRNGAMLQNLATNFNGQTGSVSAAPVLTATAVEYYYAAWNFYFETAFPQEIAALDGGAFGGAWQRTGQTFTVWNDPSASPMAVSTCRFFSTAFAPKSSHFYTPFPNECAMVKTEAAWEYESVAFYIALANADGTCSAGTIPLYRAYDNGMGGAPNHRYTTSLAVLNQMIAAGWVFEGNGDTKVFACVPQ